MKNIPLSLPYSHIYIRTHPHKPNIPKVMTYLIDLLTARREIIYLKIFIIIKSRYVTLYNILSNVFPQTQNTSNCRI